PSAIPQTLALLEIHVVEGGTPTSPVIRCTTEITQPAGGEIEIWSTDIATDIELLRVVFERHRTALEEDDAEAGACKFACERDARGTPTDNAQVGIDQRFGRYRTRVEKHCAPLRADCPE